MTLKDGKSAIAFAVQSACDVAVYVEDANGKIVQHLAAGVLGTNTPAPLNTNALEQTLEWDGLDDDGKSAGATVPQGVRGAPGHQARAALEQLDLR
ncbi:MAG: hypothetical protein L6R28_24460 [Planctomycetes bacterium]|nr:hypothetical protein [Planctomycetota bacterium]